MLLSHLAVNVIIRLLPNWVAIKHHFACQLYFVIQTAFLFFFFTHLLLSIFFNSLLVFLLFSLVFGLVKVFVCLISHVVVEVTISFIEIFISRMVAPVLWFWRVKKDVVVVIVILILPVAQNFVGFLNLGELSMSIRVNIWMQLFYQLHISFSDVQEGGVLPYSQNFIVVFPQVYILELWISLAFEILEPKGDSFSNCPHISKHHQENYNLSLYNLKMTGRAKLPTFWQR